MRRRDLIHSRQRLTNVVNAIRRDLGSARGDHRRTSEDLGRVWNRLQDRRTGELRRVARLLETLGYRQVLSRGFALVRDADGRPVRSARNISTAAHLDIEFADGHIEVVSGGTKSSRAAKATPPRVPKQESLF